MFTKLRSNLRKNVSWWQFLWLGILNFNKAIVSLKKKIGLIFEKVSVEFIKLNIVTD